MRSLPGNFVVFCDARTGSYNLVSRLGSCPDIVCHGEIFKQNRIEVAVFHRRRLSIKSVQERNRRAMAFIRELRAINQGRHFGFKLFPTHLGWAPGALDYVLAPDTLRVLLLRTPLEIYASRLRVQRTGVYTVQTAEGPAPSANEPVHFTKESFETFAHQYNRHVNMCRMLAALPGSFVLDYEQTGEEAAMDALLGFLGSKSSFAETSSAYRKQYDGSLRDAFANWDELVAALPQLTPLAEVPAPSHAPRQPAEARLRANLP
jgi:hypothetical protein